MRSLAVSLPAACCFSMLLGPPPSSTLPFRAFKSRSLSLSPKKTHLA